MKISLEWLNRYLDHPVSADEAETLLAGCGFPIDGRDEVGGDVMIDVEVTSNRSDCLSHVGVAREVAAASNRNLVPPEIAMPQGDEKVQQLTRVDNQAPQLCPTYTARVVRGVTVGPSPDWLVRLLTTVGMRSVNNVVDVTNFVLMEMGQPLHAFDMAQLAEQRVVVREAAEGEAFEAIDGTSHKLKAGMLVIADAQKPVALAGVMGGLNSEVTSETRDVLLESAVFEPLSVRRTSRSLKMASDSSYRFERGVDPQGVERASERAAQLLADLAGGTVARGVIRVGEDVPQQHSVSMRVARCSQLLGVELAGEKMVELLTPLQLSPRLEGDKIVCTIPSFRLDLHREVDLIEEVARLYGLENIPVNEKMSLVVRSPQQSVQARKALANVLVAHGYHETVTFSFTSERLGKPFLPPGTGPVLVDDERRKAEPMLRPAVLPSLLSCRKSNQDVGNVDVRLFETAATWAMAEGKIQERMLLTLLADAPDNSAALRGIKGTLDELAQRLIGEEFTFTPTQDSRFESAALVKLAGQDVGTVGLLSSDLQHRFDLQTPVVAAELNLPQLLEQFPPRRSVQRLSRFPGIERDLSIIVDESVAWQQVLANVEHVAPQMLEQVQFITTYRGKQVGKGRKSVSFRMVFRDPSGTLRHDQVDPQVESVVARLKSELSAELRN